MRLDIGRGDQVKSFMNSGDLGDRFGSVRAGTKRHEADIYQTYAEMRRESPLWRAPWGDVYLSSYELVSQAFASSAMSHAVRPALPNCEGHESELSPFADWLLFMDGADHALMRRAVQGPLVSGDGTLDSRVANIVDEQLTAVDFNCPIDAVPQFTRLIPERVIGSMLGVPIEDLPRIRSWSEEIRTILDVGMEPAAARNAGPVTDLADYFYEILKRRPANGASVGDFKMDELIDAVGERTAASNLAFLSFAGHETTVHSLGSLLLHLSKTPAVWEVLRKTPDLAPIVVSEVLRLESPVQKACRWALKDIEFASGQKLHKGEYTVLLLGAANRDPSKFSNPDQIDLTRVQNAHFAFGKGLHTCLGRGLALLEGAAVLRWLIENVNAIVLNVDEPEWIQNSSFRGLQRLPITLER